MGRSGGGQAAQTREFGSMEEFWGFYLSQHSKPGTRRWHFLGTLASLACAVLAAATGRAAVLLAAPALGFGMAWYSHFFVEGNRPATFGHPVWSFLCDHRMFVLILTARIDAELARFRRPPARLGSAAVDLDPDDACCFRSQRSPPPPRRILGSSSAATPFAAASSARGVSGCCVGACFGNASASAPAPSPTGSYAVDALAAAAGGAGMRNGTTQIFFRTKTVVGVCTYFCCGLILPRSSGGSARLQFQVVGAGVGDVAQQQQWSREEGEDSCWGEAAAMASSSSSKLLLCPLAPCSPLLLFLSSKHLIAPCGLQ